jgi:Zn-dependent protease with chaperone function
LQAKLLKVGEKGFCRLGLIIQEKDLAYFHETSLPMEVALFQLFAAQFSQGHAGKRIIQNSMLIEGLVGINCKVLTWMRLQRIVLRLLQTA